MPKKAIFDRNFKKGERLFSQKDFKNAAECFQKAAEDGHADAQYMLGVMYAKGMGVEQDYKEAAKRFRKAAELGHLNAQCMLGSLYYDGKGVEEDEKKAVEWYRKAADVVAQSSLIKLYLQGSLGLPKDYEKALTWLRLAAEQGDDDSQYYLANLWKLLENAKKKGFDIQFEEQILKAESISQGTPPDDLLFGLHLDALKEKSEGNFDKAIGIWKNILGKDSQYLYAINAIAGAYAETGERHKSKKYIDMAMKVGGEQADSVRIELARILKETENFEDAEKILNAFEHKGLKGLEVIAILTHVLTSQDKMKRALELIEKFLVEEGALKPLSDDGEYSLRHIIYGGAFCMLRCKPTRVIDFLEKYGHILSPEQLHSAYLRAGENYLQEENDGVRALKCLSEAVRNEPDDSEAKEALSDAALKVIADFGGQGKISENKKAALATAYEVIDNRKKDLENKKSRGKESIKDKRKKPEEIRHKKVVEVTVTLLLDELWGESWDDETWDKEFDAIDSAAQNACYALAENLSCANSCANISLGDWKKDFENKKSRGKESIKYKREKPEEIRHQTVVIVTISLWFNEPMTIEAIKSWDAKFDAIDSAAQDAGYALAENLSCAAWHAEIRLTDSIDD